jgi:hypothetical protein
MYITIPPVNQVDESTLSVADNAMTKRKMGKGIDNAMTPKMGKGTDNAMTKRKMDKGTDNAMTKRKMDKGTDNAMTNVHFSSGHCIVSLCTFIV